jgi:ribosome-associated heat shock protein Hsp15
VRQTTTHRGSATVAARYYEETPESVAARERLESELDALALGRPVHPGRPTKRDRRVLLRMKGRCEPGAET